MYGEDVGNDMERDKGEVVLTAEASLLFLSEWNARYGPAIMLVALVGFGLGGGYQRVRLVTWEREEFEKTESGGLGSVLKELENWKARRRSFNCMWINHCIEVIKPA